MGDIVYFLVNLSRCARTGGGTRTKDLRRGYQTIALLTASFPTRSLRQNNFTQDARRWCRPIQLVVDPT